MANNNDLAEHIRQTAHLLAIEASKISLTNGEPADKIAKALLEKYGVAYKWLISEGVAFLKDQ